MTFFESIRTCFIKYADFKGCASRSEFWWFVLFGVICSCALKVIDEKLDIAFLIVTVLPNIAVSIRRLHDTNRSGWYILLGFIPILGWIISIMWYAEEGTNLTRYAQPVETEE